MSSNNNLRLMTMFTERLSSMFQSSSTTSTYTASSSSVLLHPKISKNNASKSQEPTTLPHHHPKSHNVHQTQPQAQYRRSTAPTALPLYQILTTKLFPYTTAQSFKDYQTRHDLESCQAELLTLLDDPLVSSSKEYKVLKTDIGDGKIINEVLIKPQGVSSDKLNHFVMIHGYGAGLGFYLKNFEGITKGSDDWCLHAVDSLGYGLSTRPDFHSADEFESWFVDSLEQWRQARGIDKIFLCCHSMGAIAGTKYALKYPDAVQKLMFVSPAGIVKPTPEPTAPWWLHPLWEANISPFCLIRNAGPWGSLVTSGWTYRRFAKLTKKEQQLLHTYAYRVFNAKGSGEYFMSSILSPGAVPKNPILHSHVSKLQCDTVWIYGDEDWMPKEGGLEAVEILKGKGLHAEFKTVSDSGHHLYLDNYKEFNGVVNGELEAFSKKFGVGKIAHE